MVLREQFTNGVTPTLSSAITAGSTSIGVTSVVGLSSEGYSRFQVGTEIIGVGLNGTQTWSTQVDRGIEGTVATSHTSGTGVYQRPTAGALDALVGVYGSTVLVGAVRDINFRVDSTGGGFGVTLTTGPFSTGMVNVTIPTYYSTAPTVVFSSAASPGSTGVILRSDATLAVFNAVAPTTQAFGDAASSGTAAFAARQDHKHGWPALSSGAITLSTASAAGSTTSPLRGDATIAAFDGVAPTTWAFGDAASSGTAAYAARRDHVHGAPGLSTGNITLSTAASAGSTGSPLRGDATIAAFDGSAPTTQAFGDSASSGTAAYAARRDHVHGFPTLVETAVAHLYKTGYATEPPNSSDITALFGASSSQATSTDRAFLGVLNTSGGSTSVWLVAAWKDSTSWWRAAFTLAT